MATMTDQQLWEMTFGTSGESFSWWSNLKFIEGDWDTPGIASIAIEDPDDEARLVFAELRIADIRAAAEKARETCVDACMGSAISLDEEADWDACVSDCVLQMAVLGEVVYG